MSPIGGDLIYIANYWVVIMKKILFDGCADADAFPIMRKENFYPILDKLSGAEIVRDYLNSYPFNHPARVYHLKGVTLAYDEKADYAVGRERWVRVSLTGKKSLVDKASSSISKAVGKQIKRLNKEITGDAPRWQTYF